MTVSVRGLWKRFRLRKPKTDHWALREIDFQVARGGALGVIGANGSGKSTLLQILAGVLRPTLGEVKVDGRVVAVLNPTAGFHPDLQGRANVRMLGALHGFSKAEVNRKMDAIIEFSGLDSYIDQPLRTYSAGMMIRLGVSTACHLEPEVLLVDEVLSAGDLAFQRKAAGMARNLRDQGCALVISTHALGDLATLCDRQMLLERGEIKAEGTSDEVVATYMQRVDELGGRIEPGAPPVAGARPTAPTRDVVIRSITLNGVKDPDQVEMHSGRPLTIEVEWEASEPVDDALFRIQFFRNDGLFVHGQNTVRHGVQTGTLHGRGVTRLHYDVFGLLAGDYYVAVGIWPDEYRSYTTGEAYDHRPSACILRLGAPREMGGGVAGWPCDWSIESLAAPPRLVTSEDAS
ncbi:MAG: ABC transporter ATP-binding protein [Proteobacteria bacterium]|nr:ABC transporter ATP-binding protein [Pseudomonadota bacterium]